MRKPWPAKRPRIRLGATPQKEVEEEEEKEHEKKK